MLKTPFRLRLGLRAFIPDSFSISVSVMGKKIQDLDKTPRKASKDTSKNAKGPNSDCKLPTTPGAPEAHAEASGSQLTRPVAAVEQPGGALPRSLHEAWKEYLEVSTWNCRLGNGSESFAQYVANLPAGILQSWLKDSSASSSSSSGSKSKK